MDTRQKLTLGIAAIFMVTLTIVGVTYAYFVTRITGTITQSVNIEAAKIGSVVYENGNCTTTNADPETCVATDTITLSNILPGTTIYKSFRVTNTSTVEDSSATYSVYLDSWPTEGAPHFVHGSAGSELGADNNNNVCYKSTAVESTGTTPTATCFDATSYNNIYVTLYKLTGTELEQEQKFNAVENGGTISDTSILDNAININPINSGVDDAAYVNALAGATVNGRASQDLTTSIVIDEQVTDYYVLKVEYRDNDNNQNIENNAALTLKVNIR